MHSPRLLQLLCVSVCTLLATNLSAQITLNSGDNHTVTAGIPVTTTNTLAHFGFHINNDALALDLNNNGGMWNSENPQGFSSFFGQAFLTDGPGNRGLDFDNDNDFINTGAIGQNDNYSNLWIGTLTANSTGIWGFRNAGDDDSAGIWLDINQNGVFQSSVAGLGDNRGEQLSWENGGNKTVALTAGEEYLIAFTHREGGGGSRADFRFTTPGGSEVVIKPSDPGQAGLWSFTSFPDQLLGDVTVNGNSSLTLGANVPKAIGNNLNFTNAQNNPSTLQVIGTNPGQSLEFVGTTTINPAGATIDLVNMSNVTLNSVNANGSLTILGSGLLNLPGANSFNGNQVTVGNSFDTPTLSISDSNSLAGASGVFVNNGGSLRIFGANTAIAENLTINGNGNSKSAGALHSLGSNLDYNGSVSLSGNALILKDGGGDLEFRGGINTNGFQLTLQNDNTVRLFNNGMTGAGTLIKEGPGVYEIRTNSASYSGQIIINDGIIDLNNNPTGLGNTTGNTVVNSGGTLRLRDGATTSENIVLNGLGNNNNEGALRSENNSNTINGNVTLASDSRIHVNNNQITINGIFGGNGNLEKTGTGSLILGNAGNNFSGNVLVSQGTLQANSVGAFGSTPGIALDKDTTLLVSGNGTLNTPIVASNNATIGNPTVGTTLTVSNISVGLRDSINVGGDGNLVITSSIGNGAIPIQQSNALAHFGYHINNDAVALDLNNNGGLLGGGDPFTGPNFNGLAFLTNGPGNRGLDFDNDADFVNTGAIGQNDNYSNLWIGTITPNVSGSWGFRNAGDDDSAGIWLDIDRNGTFESSVAGLGDNRGEQLSWENGGNKTVNLTAGQDYLIAFTHREGGGGSRADFRFTAPGQSETIIKPGDPAQSGLWDSFAITPSNGITKFGAGTTTLAASNTYNGMTTVEEGTLVAAANNALGFGDGTAASGTVVNGGATLEITGGSNIGNEAITLGSLSGAATLRSTSGPNVSGGGITLASDGTIDTQSGSSLNIGGGVDLNGSLGGRLTVVGAGETTIQGAITGTSATTSIGPTLPGLIAGTIPGNGPEVGPNPGDLGVQLGVDAGQTSGAPWAGNRTIVYTGQFFDADGTFSFAENIDDKVRLYIDGQEVINSDQWNVPTTSGSTTSNSAANAGTLSFGMGPDGDGWHDFELRMSNGGGGAGANNCCAGWSTSFGFGLNVDGSTSTDGSNYIIPMDDGTGNLFRQAAPVVVNANDLLFRGDGILRLNGDSTYVGTTSVGDTNGAFGTPNATSGILIVNGNTSGQGSYYISSGTTLGGNGTIGLATGESVNISGQPGTVSPGDAGAGYAPVPSGNATFSFGTDVATVGSLSFNAASASDTALDLDGNLLLDVVSPTSFDFIEAIQGTVDLDSTTSVLNINGETDFSQLDLGAAGFANGDEIVLINAPDGLFGAFSNNAKDGDSFVDAGGMAFTFRQDGTSLALVAAAVPEPATLATWTLLGVLGLAWRRRQAKIRAAKN